MPAHITIKPWLAITALLIIGLVVFGTGLTNPFIGDDSGQIVDNVPVHSLANVPSFFGESTFYDGHNQTHLTGIYYRPLMTTAYSAIYSVFGPQPIAFHVIQLLLGIGCAFMLYLFLAYSVSNMMAFLAAVVFLIHPVNSQTLFAIASLQDVLCFLFGITALWLLLRFKSRRSLILVALCLLLSLFSKETGLLFIAFAVAHLCWWDRKRLLPFSIGTALPLVLWLTLKVHAVGLNAPSTIAPIDRVGFMDRLMTMPSILLADITHIVFPHDLMSAYWWVHPQFSIKDVLVPLLVDIVICAALVASIIYLRKRASKSTYYTYLFFVAWFVLSIGIHLQLIPLDFTASDPWLYLPMAGLLGMITVFWEVTRPTQRYVQYAIASGAVVICLMLGIGTALRGLDYRSEVTLARHDLAIASDSFSANYQLAMYYFNTRKDYQTAKVYAERSVATFPNATNEAVLGSTLAMLGEYARAYAVLHEGLKYRDYYVLYDNLATLTIFFGDPTDNQRFLQQAITKLPNDGILWYYLAILDARYGDRQDAKSAITEAVRLGQGSQALYDAIMSGQPFRFAYDERTVIDIP